MTYTVKSERRVEQYGRTVKEVWSFEFGTDDDGKFVNIQVGVSPRLYSDSGEMTLNVKEVGEVPDEIREDVSDELIAHSEML